MHQALYRKWRPRTFGDVYGQEHITSVLKYEIEHNKLSHAYLFCGSRGVGKTTCAKILAKAVNCESPANGEPCVAVKNGDYYMVEIDGINPQDLDEQVIVIVTDAQGNSLTVNYGPMNYIVRMNAKGSDSLKALLKAMYNYHLAAEALSVN